MAPHHGPPTAPPPGISGTLSGTCNVQVAQGSPAPALFVLETEVRGAACSSRSHLSPSWRPTLPRLFILPQPLVRPPQTGQLAW